MILGIATVFATYASVRFYEHHRKNRRNDAHGKAGIKNGLTIGQEETPEPFSEDQLLAETDENKKNKHYVAMSGVSIGFATVRVFCPPLTLPTILIFTYTAIPYLRQTEKSLLKDKKVDGYVLYSIADMMMLGLGAYAAASVGIGLLHLSKYILSNAKDRFKRQLIDVFSQQPDKVWVIKNGVEVQVSIDQVKENDILVVAAGDIIPVDGTVIDGVAAVDQKVLTGESQPVDKTVDTRVFASTMVLSGQIHIRMEKSGQETVVAKIGEIINQSIDFNGNKELKGEKWADTFTTPTLALALLSWPFLGPVGVVGILYCHIANTVRVVAPLSTLRYLNAAMENGILVKDGHALEELTNIDTIIFDKTGTLTQEVPEVGEIILCGSRYTRNDILFFAAAAEQKSIHPIAKAILRKAEDKQMVLPKIEDSSYDVGYGISVEVDGKIIQVGSIRFMQMKAIKIPKTMQDKMDRALAMGYSVIMLAIDSKLEGMLEIHTIVRPEAEKAVQVLRERGIKCIAIVSGDHEAPTRVLANALGMDNYFHDILPEEKAAIVERLQKKGKKVAVVGDGVNDAIAMEKADISISLSGASTIATDVAQVVLMDGSLMHIPDLIELSRGLDKNLSRSLILNIIPNIIALNGVLFFRFGMLTTMLVSQSPLVLGTINALFPVNGKSAHSPDSLADNKEKTMLFDKIDLSKENPQASVL